MAEDFGVNADWNALLNRAVQQLQQRLAYEQVDATKLMRAYLEVFTNVKRCDEMGIPVQDEDYFFHEGEIGLALRAHYCLTLKGKPDHMSYVNWRADYFQQLHGVQNRSLKAR